MLQVYIYTKTMALFKLTRQWQGRKAVLSFVASGNTLATKQFPLLKDFLKAELHCFKAMLGGLKSKYRGWLSNDEQPLDTFDSSVLVLP